MKEVLHRFSQNAREALVRSQIIARTEAHSFVATHHLLLAITQLPESLAFHILKDMGVDTTKVAEVCSRIIVKQRQETQTKGIEDELKLVIQYAFEEAADLGSVYAGTEHLLLGIASLDRSLAAQILLNSQVDLEELRTKIHELADDFDDALKLPKLESPEGSILTLYGRDLTQEAAEHRLDPVIGRDTEIDRVIQILSRRTKNNPVLLGEAGVGKTAIIEGLAQKIQARQVPSSMMGRRIISLNVGALVAGTKFRGDFEERMMRLLREAQDEQNVVLFIDEIHMLLGAGSAAGSLDAANMLKPLLAKGEIQTIGATTFDEYQEYIEEDAALTRRFQVVNVDEPTSQQTVQILKNLRPLYEAFHHVRYDQQSLYFAAEAASRYLTERRLPDSAIDLIDEAAALVKTRQQSAPSRISLLNQQLEEYTAEKHRAVADQQYDKAVDIRNKEAKLRQRLQSKTTSDKKIQRRQLPIVQKDDIAQVLASWVNIPAQEINQSEAESLLKLEDRLHQRVVGQDQAIKLISQAVRRSRLGIQSSQRPIAAFLFLGPSGVGKTETARALAEAVFGHDSLIKINMSEYMERYSASSLIGAPAGYIGYEEGGKLTEMVRRRPYSVILFDEMEKAHPDIFNLLLQVLEDGELVDAKGRSVDFRNTIIIFTSNLGSELLSQKGKIGFSVAARYDELQQKAKENEDVYGRLIENLHEQYRPEFLNRLSGIVAFRSLTQEQAQKVARLLFKDLANRLKPLKVKIKIDHTALAYLATVGQGLEMGVRPMRRLIEQEIEDKITDGLLRQQFAKGDVLSISASDQQILVTKVGD